jgi:hypothetical protein
LRGSASTISDVPRDHKVRQRILEAGEQLLRRERPVVGHHDARFDVVFGEIRGHGVNGAFDDLRVGGDAHLQLEAGDVLAAPAERLLRSGPRVRRIHSTDVAGRLDTATVSGARSRSRTPDADRARRDTQLPPRLGSPDLRRANHRTLALLRRYGRYSAL